MEKHIDLSAEAARSLQGYLDRAASAQRDVAVAGGMILAQAGVLTSDAILEGLAGTVVTFVLPDPPEEEKRDTTADLRLHAPFVGRAELHAPARGET